MNLIGCWFGAMPVCHGSGGLAAQFRFGARSGASIIFLGLIKLFLGLFVGNGMVGLLKVFPKSLLGVMVIATGLELAKVGESLNTAGARDLWQVADDDSESTGDKKFREVTEEERNKRWAVMLVTVGGILAFRNDAAGFIAGMLCHLSHTIPGWLKRRRLDRGGHIRLDNETPPNMYDEELHAEVSHTGEEAGNGQ